MLCVSLPSLDRYCVILQRPIVEFSLEDMRKLKIKEMRLQKSKVCFYQTKPRLPCRVLAQINLFIFIFQIHHILCDSFYSSFQGKEEQNLSRRLMDQDLRKVQEKRSRQGQR